MKRSMITILAVVAALLSVLVLTGAALADTVYSSLPPVPTYNTPSVAFEATSTAEFGGEILLAGTARTLSSVTVAFSDWSLKSTYFNPDGTLKAAFNPAGVQTDAGNTGFYVPVTVNIYSVNHSGATPAVGAVLASVTSNTLIPWRPENSGLGDGASWTAPDGQEYHGSLSTADFDFSSLGVTLPDDVVVGIAYNTTHYGYSPTGLDGPVESLNVATYTGASVGTQVNPNGAFLNSTWAGAYGDNGAGGIGTFRYDPSSWTGYAAAFSVQAVPEPATMSLLAAGGLALLRRRKQ